MSFRLIRNRAQQIAVIGFLVTLGLCIVLGFMHVLAIDITLPFTMVWIMVWLLAATTNRNQGE